jgi:hypothetical protein
MIKRVGSQKRERFVRPFASAILLIASVAAANMQCDGSGAIRTADGVRVAELPREQEEPYALFADRCSKCHALSRALDAGYKDNVFWVRYVTRMRRQPGSGISEADEKPILAFLNYYSEQVRRRQETR